MVQFKPVDIVKATGAPKSTVIRIERELGIVPKRVHSRGDRRYSLRQAKKLIAEIEKRRNPARALGVEVCG